jgi:OmpA-OmpF porin, OOP family
MSARSRVSSLLLVGILGSFTSAAAQAPDVQGSSDHPGVSRFAGSTIIQFKKADFGVLVLPLSPPGKATAKSQNVEGGFRQILYRIPAGRHSHEVFRTYETALKQSGFQTLYACIGDAQCGSAWPGYLQGKYGVFMGGVEWDSQRYLAAKRTAPDGDVYVMLYAYDEGSQSKALIVIVDVAPLAAGLVTINAADMAKDIGAAGHVPVYGVLFDVDKGELKPESTPALREMAKLLEQQPRLHVAIVGHTDNVGALEHNLALSERRAAAVVRALVSQYRIDATRLLPKGVGPLAPVMSNATEAGRAKNRRVELVAR